MKKLNNVRDAYKDDKINAIVYSIEISQIIPNSNQPRKNFDIKSISKLADSIRRYGLLQPLSVREIAGGENGSKTSRRYELIAGERRLRACKMLGMARVSCIIVDATEETSAELAIIENLLRENLNFFEQAKAFSKLSTAFCLTQDEIALKMSLSQSAVANKLRLLRLTEEEQNLILSAELTERHARALLRISSASMRKQALEYIIVNKLNVSQTERFISDYIKTPDTVISPKEKAYTSDLICQNIYKFAAKLQKDSGNLIVNRKSDDKSVIITLIVKKDA